MLLFIAFMSLVVSIILFVEYMVYDMDDVYVYSINKRLQRMEEGTIDQNISLLAAVSMQFNDDIHGINNTIKRVKTQVIDSFRPRRRNALELLAEDLN